MACSFKLNNYIAIFGQNLKITFGPTGVFVINTGGVIFICDVLKWVRLDP